MNIAPLAACGLVQLVPTDEGLAKAKETIAFQRLQNAYEAINVIGAQYFQRAPLEPKYKLDLTKIKTHQATKRPNRI